MGLYIPQDHHPDARCRVPKGDRKETRQQIDRGNYLAKPYEIRF